jgi:hypothetical protein
MDQWNEVVYGLGHIFEHFSVIEALQEGFFYRKYAIMKNY